MTFDHLEIDTAYRNHSLYTHCFCWWFLHMEPSSEIHLESSYCNLLCRFGLSLKFQGLLSTPENVFVNVFTLFHTEWILKEIISVSKKGYTWNTCLMAFSITNFELNSNKSYTHLCMCKNATDLAVYPIVLLYHCYCYIGSLLSFWLPSLLKWIYSSSQIFALKYYGIYNQSIQSSHRNINLYKV